MGLPVNKRSELTGTAVHVPVSGFLFVKVSCAVLKFMTTYVVGARKTPHVDVVFGETNCTAVRWTADPNKTFF